jgi:hypothetical protein
MFGSKISSGATGAAAIGIQAHDWFYNIHINTFLAFLP